jgi:predicted SnoaL-like aldol condensation-catalyzing enzyme
LQVNKKLTFQNRKWKQTKSCCLLKAIETGATEPVGVINSNKYIQHNLAVADGLAGFAEVLKALPPNSAKVNTARVFQDGNFVFAHTDYNFFGPKIGFDIFRFEDGKIVEHWDNLQEKPEKPNPSGHTMIDGTTEIKDKDLTEKNKTYVRQFAEDIFVNGKREKLVEYLSDNYIQHNPNLGDGLAGLTAGAQRMPTQGAAPQGRPVQFTAVHKVLGEGNFVLLVSEGTFFGKHSSFYDLFRVENGKISEHCDVIEPIAPKKIGKITMENFKIVIFK